MSYQVFARKYRPRTFDDVLGQDHVVQTLKNAIEQGRLAHAYLLVGPRGTGKTSTARILAKALNCTDGPKVAFDPDEEVCEEIAEGRSLDVLEIDGASNNGVDDIRELREAVEYAPSRGQFKIFYIDEVHMLSTAAFNALLKTLEEPPDHVKFIFATTEVRKILPTILSRCQRFDLRPISTQIIADHLQHIASKENITLDAKAAWAIAKGADGGMRDGQSMLDQLVAFCGDTITEEDVLEIFGFTSREKVAELAKNLLKKEHAKALQLIQEEAESGRELSQLLGEIISCLRGILIARFDSSTDGEGIPEELWKEILSASESYQPERLLAAIDVFAETEGKMKWATNKRLHFELGLIKAIQILSEVRINDVIKVLTKGSDHLDSAPAQATPLGKKPESDASIPIPPKVEPTKEVAKPAAPAPKLRTPTKEKKAKSSDTISAFQDLIDSAPDEADEPPPTIDENSAPKPTAEKTEPKAAQVIDADFHKDALIEETLKLFEGSYRMQQT